MRVEACRVCFDHPKACMKLVKFEESVLHTAMHVGGLYDFGESVLITANRVGCLWRFEESVFTTVKRI